jgi:HEPN domain-containing protein
MHFFLHLTLEKVIKALIVSERGEHAPYSHSLSYLLGKTSLAPPERYIEDLTEMSKFNMQARYPDEKLAFYTSIDLASSQHWHKIGMEIRAWLLSSLKKS